MNADLEQLKAEHAECLQLMQLNDFMAAVNDLLDKKDAELDRLRKIAACFEKGDADRLDKFSHGVAPSYFPEDFETVRRMYAAAKLAEDGA